jgi:GntR family carbon starvation induced transcriptional regulator
MARNGDTGALSEDPRLTLAEMTSAKLRADIISGQFKPGERLQMDTLCERYAVSMSPLREALAGLAGEQFVTFEGRRGYRVAILSVDDLNDLTETRKAIEGEVIRRAIRHGDDAWESAVITAFHRLSFTERRNIEIGRRDDKEGELRNREFHSAIAAGCPLRWLNRLCAQMFMMSQRYRALAWAALPDAATVAAEHREIFEAVTARDEARAIKANDNHIEQVAVVARALVSSTRK